jgi:hypothetical protein
MLTPCNFGMYGGKVDPLPERARAGKSRAIGGASTLASTCHSWVTVANSSRAGRKLVFIKAFHSSASHLVENSKGTLPGSNSSKASKLSSQKLKLKLDMHMWGIICKYAQCSTVHRRFARVYPPMSCKSWQCCSTDGCQVTMCEATSKTWLQQSGFNHLSVQLIDSFFSDIACHLFLSPVTLHLSHPLLDQCTNVVTMMESFIAGIAAASDRTGSRGPCR